MIWPATVATAAPATSSRGKPNSPKIRMGSKIRLMTEPVPWMTMAYTVRPVAWTSRSVATDMKIPMLHPAIMVR